MHPLTAIIAMVSLVIQLLMLKHPLVILIAFISMLALLLLQGALPMLKKTYNYAKWPILLILIINPIMVSLGEHIVISHVIGPFTLSISLEAILYAFLMAIKLFLIMIAFQLISLLADQDDVFTFMSRYCRQLTLTLSMSGNAVEALKHEYDRVQMVMFTRGMPLNQGNLIIRFNRSVYLIKVVLISVLEGTFHRSEALYVRQYTKTPGSCYQPLKWRAYDQVTLGLEGGILVAIIVAISLNYYQFDYYPTMNGHINILALLVLILTYVIIFKGMKEQKNDQCLSID